MHYQWIDFSALENYKPGKPTILLDDEGNEWARFQHDRREPIRYDQMPEHLINAFIAAEDWNFFYHNGLSWKGIVRSTCVNLYHGRKVQGASTITQQLVKLLFFDSTKTFSRKIKEQLCAVFIERQYNQEEYLKRISIMLVLAVEFMVLKPQASDFGSERYFSKMIKSATVAAVVRSPGRYCPILCPLSAQQRRNIILKNA